MATQHDAELSRFAQPRASLPHLCTQQFSLVPNTRKQPGVPKSSVIEGTMSMKKNAIIAPECVVSRCEQSLGKTPLPTQKPALPRPGYPLMRESRVAVSCDRSTLLLQKNKTLLPTISRTISRNPGCCVTGKHTALEHCCEDECLDKESRCYSSDKAAFCKRPPNGGSEAKKSERSECETTSWAVRETANDVVASPFNAKDPRRDGRLTRPSRLEQGLAPGKVKHGAPCASHREEHRSMVGTRSFSYCRSQSCRGESETWSSSRFFPNSESSNIKRSPVQQPHLSFSRSASDAGATCDEKEQTKRKGSLSKARRQRWSGKKRVHSNRSHNAKTASTTSSYRFRADQLQKLCGEEDVLCRIQGLTLTPKKRNTSSSPVSLRKTGASKPRPSAASRTVSCSAVRQRKLLEPSWANKKRNQHAKRGESVTTFAMHQPCPPSSEIDFGHPRPRLPCTVNSNVSKTTSLRRQAAASSAARRKLASPLECSPLESFKNDCSKRNCDDVQVRQSNVATSVKNKTENKVRPSLLLHHSHNSPAQPFCSSLVGQVPSSFIPRGASLSENQFAEKTAAPINYAATSIVKSPSWTTAALSVSSHCPFVSWRAEHQECTAHQQIPLSETFVSQVTAQTDEGLSGDFGAKASELAKPYLLLSKDTTSVAHHRCPLRIERPSCSVVNDERCETVAHHRKKEFSVTAVNADEPLELLELKLKSGSSNRNLSDHCGMPTTVEKITAASSESIVSGTEKKQIVMPMKELQAVRTSPEQGNNGKLRSMVETVASGSRAVLNLFSQEKTIAPAPQRLQPRGRVAQRATQRSLSASPTFGRLFHALISPFDELSSSDRRHEAEDCIDVGMRQECGDQLPLSPADEVILQKEPRKQVSKQLESDPHVPVLRTGKPRRLADASFFLEQEEASLRSRPHGALSTCDREDVSATSLSSLMDPAYATELRARAQLTGGGNAATQDVNSTPIGAKAFPLYTDGGEGFAAAADVDPNEFRAFTRLLISARGRPAEKEVQLAYGKKAALWGEGRENSECLPDFKLGNYEEELPPKRVSAISRPENTLIIWDWDDTILPTYDLAVEHQCCLTDTFVPEPLKQPLQILEEKALRSLRLSMRNGCTILVTNASFRWLTDSAVKYFPKLWSFIKARRVKILSARDICQPLGVPQSDWKRLLIRDQVERFFQHLVVPHACVEDAVQRVPTTLDDPMVRKLRAFSGATASLEEAHAVGGAPLDAASLYSETLEERVKLDLFARCIGQTCEIPTRLLAMAGLLVARDLTTVSVPDTNEKNAVAGIVAAPSTELTAHLPTDNCPTGFATVDKDQQEALEKQAKDMVEKQWSGGGRALLSCPVTHSYRMLEDKSAGLTAFLTPSDPVEHRIVDRCANEILARHRFLPGLGLVSETPAPLNAAATADIVSGAGEPHQAFRPPGFCSAPPPLPPQVIATISAITSSLIAAHTEKISLELPNDNDLCECSPVDYSSAVLHMLSGGSQHALVIHSIPEGKLELPTAMITTSFPYIIVPEGKVRHIRDLFPAPPASLGLQETPCSVISIGDGQGEREAVLAAMVHWDINHRAVVRHLEELRSRICSLFTAFIKTTVSNNGSSCMFTCSEENASTAATAYQAGTKASLRLPPLLQAPSASWTFKSLKLNPHPTVEELSATHDALHLALLVCLDQRHSIDACITSAKRANASVSKTGYSCQPPTKCGFPPVPRLSLSYTVPSSQPPLFCEDVSNQHILDSMVSQSVEAETMKLHDVAGKTRSHVSSNKHEFPSFEMSFSGLYYTPPNKNGCVSPSDRNALAPSAYQPSFPSTQQSVYDDASASIFSPSSAALMPFPLSPASSVPAAT